MSKGVEKYTDMMTTIFAANKAKKDLMESGGVGYAERSETTVFKDLTLPAGKERTTKAFETELVAGETYIVTINGVKYERVCKVDAGYEVVPYIGNPSINNVASLEDNGDHFCINRRNATYLLVGTTDTSVERTISCVQRSEAIHPIDPKFIPPMDSITLNGADGKQYKVTVNESGALTATAIA